MAVVDAPLAALISEVRRLHDRIHGWSPTSWREPCVPYRFGANSPEPGSGVGAGGAGVAAGPGTGTRADRTRALAVELAGLGREAGSGLPAGVGPPLLADHALADQIAVLATDLIETLAAAAASAAPAHGSFSWNDLVERARLAVRAARIDLETSRRWRAGGLQR
ncbi:MULTISPECIES: hypothetical protein [Protofrankia]|uniref:hypothetical protein n=1 Tax=Protofrankia TaxID=2994361 RepID=UPI001F1E271D|nr:MULTISPECIES: hypothetical protein [Protofrankia]